jgi:tetratricopeptide (TPR) repeat protein
MKKFLFIFFTNIGLLIQSNIIFAQTITTSRQVQTLLSGQSIYLNGTANGASGGKSRTYYKIDLPANTIEWYYIYSTSASEGGNKTLELASQLSKLIDPTGLTSIAATSLFAPSGESVIDIYVMGPENKGYFMKKDSWGAWEYENPGGYDEGKTVNAKQGKARIDDVKNGTVYIGIKNPDTWNGVNVNIEVAAIVEIQETNLSEWSSKTKSELYNTFKENIITNGIDDDIASTISNCIVNKLIITYTPADFSELSENEINQIVEKTGNDCLQSLGAGEKTEEQQKGKTYGSLGWKAYENGEIDKAIDYSKKALLKDNTLGWVHANLGLFYLIKNDELTAIDYYIEAISFIKKNKLDAKSTFKETIDDINNALTKYPELKGYKEIIEQLQQEYNNL